MTEAYNIHWRITKGLIHSQIHWFKNPTGVHPEDWNSNRDPGNADQRWPTSTYDKDDLPDRDGDGRQNRKDRKKNRNQRRKDRLGDDLDAGVGVGPGAGVGGGMVGPSVIPEIDDRKGPWNDNSDNMNQQQQNPGLVDIIGS